MIYVETSAHAVSDRGDSRRARERDAIAITFEHCYYTYTRMRVYRVVRADWGYDMTGLLWQDQIKMVISPPIIPHKKSWLCQTVTAPLIHKTLTRRASDLRRLRAL